MKARTHEKGKQRSYNAGIPGCHEAVSQPPSLLFITLHLTPYALCPIPCTLFLLIIPQHVSSLCCNLHF